MKVVSISANPAGNFSFLPYQHFTRARALPCEYVECYDAEEVYKHGISADVIFLPGSAAMWPLFWNDIANYVQELPAFVGVFSADSYRMTWPPGERKIHFDALFPLYEAAYRQRAGEFAYDCEYVFPSPCCVDVQDHNVEKDIDVLFWGNPGNRTYPFRNFVLRELTLYSYNETIRDNLIFNVLSIGGENYSYARAAYQDATYWGYSLYPLLERARICCTGSSSVFVPLARYFENAACGCVSLTNDFSDREALGFEDGKNIWLTTEDKFIDDLVYLLSQQDLLAAMSANARQLIAERHTVNIRADHLYRFLVEVGVPE